MKGESRMTNPKVRDTVFCKYMSTEDHLLAVLNAIKGTYYTDSSSITINTLSGSFYSNIKNDIAFMLDTLIMMLIEHQTISLSDAFLAPSDKLELMVNVYNLADGMNEDLKDRCRPLNEYSIFSNHYKQLRKQRYSVDEAVSETISYCIKNNVMREYLVSNESEVINMFGFERNEEEERQALLECGEARGKTLGIKIGKISTIRDMLADGLVTMEALKASGRYSPDELAAISKL